MDKLIGYANKKVRTSLGISDVNSDFPQLQSSSDHQPQEEKKIGMEKLIETVNKLQDVFNTLGMPNNSIELPQIVMVGSQSSGKSSVLESIVRRPFLPRGTGIVTRCPLILQLIRCPIVDGDQVKEWGEFLHKKGEKFTDFDKIRQEIEKQTVELAGANKGIVEDPINLKIYSSKFVNLTLVDLPGITKVPVGDQPEDIEKQSCSLILKYITNPKSIILAVSPANSDIANSDSLKLAQSKDVDPNGSRTLAVLTKLDLMDLGTDATEILKGEVIPVKLGIIGVVLRSQQDIKNNKSIEEQLASEDRFLKTNYSKVADIHGVPYLEQKLSKLLMNHIRESLPELRKNISKEIARNKDILKTCGEKISDPKNFLVEIIYAFNKNFQDTINGTLAYNLKKAEKYVGGPAFRKIFDHTFEQEINDIKAEVSKNETIKQINASGGARPSVFAPESLFLLNVKNNIELLEGPSLICVNDINQEMEKVIKHTITIQQELQPYPALKHMITEIAMNLLQSRYAKTSEFVEKFIAVEKGCINTNHPHFEESWKIYEKQVQENQNNGNCEYDSEEAEGEVDFRTKKAEKDADVINDLVVDYFEIVKTTVKDIIPKYIMYDFVDYMKENIHYELMKNLDVDKQNLFAESEIFSKQRDEAKKMLEALNSAQKIISDVHEYI